MAHLYLRINLDAPVNCSGCKSSNLDVDHEKKEVTCHNCGRVIDCYKHLGEVVENDEDYKIRKFRCQCGADVWSLEKNKAGVVSVRCAACGINIPMITHSQKEEVQ